MKNSILTVFVLLALVLGSYAYSDDDASKKENELEQNWKTWSFALSPRYLRQSRDNLTLPLLVSNFSAAKADLFGLEVSIDKRFDGGTLVGFQFGWIGSNQNIGANEAAYANSYFGVEVNYEFFHTGPSAFYVGSGLGGSFTQLQILSSVQNGRLQEMGLYFQPTVGWDYLLSPSLKIGVSGAYFVAFTQSTNITGQSLGTSEISPRGGIAQINFTFGKF